ncbi:hypothetical protein PYCCODRAFT_1449351 [Trametes coccinea BRFM310]|uniref:Uncharacterized protein n=1 Tax=Trametes coccinea (strain BRFM310) TaxID=1353009 RepID=A0A1Y2J1L6_TRAC3|nr:hypothetical protein PYCCODRAFT_1449351 [Trametes coccinea BRFM310]
MGGNAFKAIVPNAIFPRMPPPVYYALKASLYPVLQPLYARVVVPREAPGKEDYGDLDFVVCGPREGVTPAEVKTALRATHSVPMEGFRTSNFAIALDAWEDVARASQVWAATNPEVAEGGDRVYLQVDVHVCPDLAHLERKVFESSYGDLGLMLGLLVQTAGLSLSVYGLKLAEPVGSPPRTFYLSDDVSEILSFLGLSMERWERGFATQDELLQWVASSPFAIAFAEYLKSKGGMPAERPRDEARPLRQKFIAFLQAHTFSLDSGEPSVFVQLGHKDEKLAAALKYFRKEKEYAALVDVARAATRAKAVLNGKNVQEWTGVMGMPVRFILDEMKERLASHPAARTSGEGLEVLGDVPLWQRALLEMPDEEVRMLMVQVKEELEAAGKLEFDWRAAKAAKLEQRRQKERAADSESVDASATEAVLERQDV